MEPPKVSVITPAYNAGRYLNETIQSILGQSFKDFEYIIIDDRSTDNTWNIIKKYSRIDNRIVFVRNKENLGIAGNRNRGISLAKGKYIAWQDADDISLPDRVKKQYRFLEKHSSVGMCGGYIRFFNEKGVIGVRKYAVNDSTVRSKIFLYSPVAQPTAMIRTKCFKELGQYDLSCPPAEDLDMAFRIGTKYKFANIPEVLLEYRVHPDSATYSKLKRIEINTIRIRKKYAKKYGYKMSLRDRVYCYLQYVSIFLIPPRIKIWLFNSIRNSKE
ncbi:MAG: glycosyltransferase [Patescibacteria group bacterium]